MKEGRSGKKRSAKKKLRFHFSAKTWDGQRQEHILLERLALDYWQSPPKKIVLDKLLDSRNVKMLRKMRDILAAAIERIKQNFDSKEGAELIPGGGNQGIRLQSINLPHARRLLADITEVYDAVHTMCCCEC